MPTIDQIDMAFIPGGEFIMGRERNTPPPGYVDDSPHKVILNSFYLDRTEVSNVQYLRFCQATGHRLPFFWGLKDFHSGPDFPDHPVTGISYNDAEAYAQWRGCRLPTEAEWEYAARGGLVGKDFPNGDALGTKDGNIGHESRGTVKVASFPSNGFGLFDMAGNVGEWVADYYDQHYYQNSPLKNPQGPAVGRFRVIRGGGWYSGPSCNAVHYRNALPQNWVDFNVGFRCARNAGGLLRVHYLGHSAFALDFDSGPKAVVDFGVSDVYAKDGFYNPIFPLNSLTPDIALFSHRHPDHFNPPALPAATRVLEPGHTIQLEDLTITPIPTYERTLKEPDNFSHLFVYRGIKILHLGDCQALIYYVDKPQARELINVLYPDSYDLVFLPVGFVTDITAQAVEFLGLIQARRVIPMHYWKAEEKNTFLALLEKKQIPGEPNYRIEKKLEADYLLPLDDPTPAAITVISLEAGPYVEEKNQKDRRRY